MIVHYYSKSPVSRSRRIKFKSKVIDLIITIPNKFSLNLDKSPPKPLLMPMDGKPKQKKTMKEPRKRSSEPATERRQTDGARKERQKDPEARRAEQRQQKENEARKDLQKQKGTETEKEAEKKRKEAEALLKKQ